MSSRCWVVTCLVLVLAACAPARPAITAPTGTDSAAHQRESAALASRLGLAPGLAHRHLTRTLTAADQRALATIEEGLAKPIAGLSFDRATSFPSLGHVPPNAVAYVLVDDEAKEMRPVGWHDRELGDVVEVSTGYRLRVIDPPGTKTRDGERGESFFAYGFAWYPRWNRILPEPIVSQLDTFYSRGIEHIKDKLAQYKEVARPSHSGGDLRLVTWNDSVLARMFDWGNKLPAAPYVHLPDSGKIDLRPKRFEEAVVSQRVIVDQTSLESYREAERTRERFETVPSEDEIRAVLLAPFRHPDRFSEVDQAILLDAVYDGDAPLRLIIDASVGGGFFVPDNGNKEVHIAYSEVDLNFRYNGLIFAKLAHEAHHVVEFRQRPFLAERCWHHRDDVIETLKYLNEFMWWVEHYPGDAPNWDWAPINAGIVLASLLEGYFPNSRC